MASRKRAKPVPTAILEQVCITRGARWVVGVDEVGRGALAGPVVACATCFDADTISSWEHRGLADSKMLTPAQREELAGALCADGSVVYAYGSVSSSSVDAMGIVPATMLAMRQAIEGIDVDVDHVLVDGNVCIEELELFQTPVVKGDSISISIAAASILAKVKRDREMVRYAQRYSGYAFEQHKGYGTAVHQSAIAQMGPCALHRRTFLSE